MVQLDVIGYIFCSGQNLKKKALSFLFLITADHVDMTQALVKKKNFS